MAQAEWDFTRLRNKLIQFFRARGCRDEADELADDSMSRVLSKLRDVTIQNISAYALQTGRHVFFEWLRDKSHRPSVSVDELAIAAREEDDTKERRQECLDRSLPTLSAEELRLLRSFYWEDRGAKDLGSEWGISENAVLIRIHRIRKKLERQISDCLENKKTV